jgi:hypothetical protein
MTTYTGHDYDEWPDGWPKWPNADDDQAETAARTIGAQHAEAGQVWDTNGTDSAQLMASFGEYGPTTEANADYRNRICDAYNEGIASVIDPGEEGTWR